MYHEVLVSSRRCFRDVSFPLFIFSRMKFIDRLEKCNLTVCFSLSSFDEVSYSTSQSMRDFPREIRVVSLT